MFLNLNIETNLTVIYNRDQFTYGLKPNTSTINEPDTIWDKKVHPEQTVLSNESKVVLAQGNNGMYHSYVEPFTVSCLIALMTHALLYTKVG